MASAMRPRFAAGGVVTTFQSFAHSLDCMLETKMNSDTMIRILITTTIYPPQFLNPSLLTVMLWPWISLARDGSELVHAKTIS